MNNKPSSTHVFNFKISYFSKWSNKRYAIFSSLHKIIHISFIAIASTFLLKPTKGLCQHIDTALIRLEKVYVVSDSPPETPLLNNVLIINSITKKDIERSPVSSLNDLLDHISGVDIRQRGPLSVLSDISFRGGNFDQTLVLINGVNFTDPQTGHFNLNIPFTQSIIKTINFYQNATAASFGISPFSGLINIITEPDTCDNIKFGLGTGMFKYVNGDLSLTFKTKRTKHLLSFDISNSKGYTTNTDFSIINVFYQNNIFLKYGKIETQIGYSDKQYGANAFYSLKYPNQYEITNTILGSISYQLTKHIFLLATTLYYRANLDCFQLIRNQPESRNNYHFTQLGGANINASINTVAGKTTISLHNRIETILSTSLGTLISNPVRFLKNDSLFYTCGSYRINNSLTLSQGYAYKCLKTEIALSGYYIYTQKNSFYLLPSAYLTYHFKSIAKQKNIYCNSINFSVSRTMRNPTFTDLFYKTGDIIGNSLLIPEFAYNFELGSIFNINNHNSLTPFFTLKATVFHKLGLNMIDYINNGEDGMWRSVNHSKINFTGVDFSIKLFPQYFLNSTGWAKYASLSYCYINSDKVSDKYVSRYVLDHLNHQVELQFSHVIYQNLCADYSFSYNNRKGEYISYKENTLGLATPYKSYYLLNARLSYQWKCEYFYVEVSNLLNQKYCDFGDLIQPGIWVKGGIKCNFNVKTNQNR